jgi:hypothetical protein
MRREIDNVCSTCCERIGSTRLLATYVHSLPSDSRSLSTSSSCSYQCDLIHPPVLACNPLLHPTVEQYNSNLSPASVSVPARPIFVPSSSTSVMNPYPTISIPPGTSVDVVVPKPSPPPVLSWTPSIYHSMLPSIQCETSIAGVSAAPIKVATFHRSTKLRPIRNRVFVTKKDKIWSSPNADSWPHNVEEDGPPPLDDEYAPHAPSPVTSTFWYFLLPDASALP